MATIAPASSSISTSASDRISVKPGALSAVRRPRKLPREAGQAVEKLAHAIEYLTDEFALECMDPAIRRSYRAVAHMAAIQLLMASNREIYLSCPEVPPLSELLFRKLSSLLPRRSA
jgi:hypothetical protein